MNAFSGISLENLVDALADRVTARLADRLKERDRGIGARLLSVKQAAEYLGRSKTSVQHMIGAGALPVVRSDRRVFLDVRELDKWIDRNRRG